MGFSVPKHSAQESRHGLFEITSSSSAMSSARLPGHGPLSSSTGGTLHLLGLAGKRSKLCPTPCEWRGICGHFVLDAALTARKDLVMHEAEPPCFPQRRALGASEERPACHTEQLHHPRDFPAQNNKSHFSADKALSYLSNFKQASKRLSNYYIFNWKYVSALTPQLKGKEKALLRAGL